MFFSGYIKTKRKMSIVAQELDYSNPSVDHGSYTWTKVTQSSGGTSVNIPLTSSPDVSVFEIPANTINLSKSYISFINTHVVTTDLFTKAFTLGACPIRSIQLVTREGLFLADITYANSYTNAILPLECTNDYVSS